MRSLLLSLMIIGLLFACAAPAVAEDGWQSHNRTTTAAYLSNATDQGAIMPVVRYYSYYGGPRWYGYRYYPRYRTTTPLIIMGIRIGPTFIRVRLMDTATILHLTFITPARACDSVSDSNAPASRETYVQ